MNNLNKYIFLLSIAILSHTVQAQVEEDIELWSSGTVKVEFTKDFRFEVEQQYRFEDTISQVRTSFTELGVRHEFTDWFDLKLQYRFSVREFERNQHRISLDASFNWDPQNLPVSFEYRMRYLDEWVDYTGEKENFLRNRFGVEYNLSNWVDPYFEYEHFYRLNNINAHRGDRYTAGLVWDIGSDAEVETFYRYDSVENIEDPEYAYIIGLGVSYDIEMH